MGNLRHSNPLQLVTPPQRLINEALKDCHARSYFEVSHRPRMSSPLLRLAAVLASLSVIFAQVPQSIISSQHENTPTLQNAKATGWPSLRFNFTLKRASMKVHGHSEFSMIATPTISISEDTILYDVFAQFTQDTILYNYTEVGGIGYLSTTSSSVDGSPSLKCYDSTSGEVPSINSIVSAINQAASAPASNSSVGIECSTGNLFMVSVNSINFGLCTTKSWGFTMRGSDMDITVEYLNNRVDIKEPLDAPQQCITTSSSSSVTAIGKSLLTGQLVQNDSTRKLRMEIDFSLDDSCTCKSKPRPCVFVHGLGIKKELARNRDRFYYWGDLDGHAPCCTSMTYTYLNTSGNPWTSDELQQKVCNRVMAVSHSSKNAVIADTIVVTHSMGNLMLAGAIANKKCSLDSTSTWVGLAGPMKGSMCSDFIQDSCAGRTTAVLETVAEVTGKCPPTTGLKSLPYQGGPHSSTELDEAYEAAQAAYRANVYAVMCGENYTGQVSLYQSIFWMLGKTVPHKSKRNDGMVEFDSCAAGIPESKFGNTYRDRFYRTKLNHFDMEFISGDAMLDEAKMPVKWFECLL
ncbi:hypothetical protein L916_01390 [Phytophthora nicotianae]|uniref:Uncharacterized protein n=1 Tax=Phytophthora nicotianae TaxID=4792 RepID=W2JRS3_PHYNI|nr:hypothetical protein L916_01390 [Phytophthora nicotianae]